MTQTESNAYILGTDRDELHRLGLQHRVWAADSCLGWQAAGFTAGQTLLDLGCGPGFCTQELAYMVGIDGQVIGVDQSEGFIDFARMVNELHGLNIDYQATSFDAMFVAHEYHDWKTFQVDPHRPALAAAIAASLQSFRVSAGDIDIGRHLPVLFHEAGMEVTTVRPMSKIALPNSLTWQWPKLFFENYLPRVVASGFLDEKTRAAAIAEWRGLESTAGASCLCPQMVEVIGRKTAA